MSVCVKGATSGPSEDIENVSITNMRLPTSHILPYDIIERLPHLFPVPL